MEGVMRRPPLPSDAARYELYREIARYLDDEDGEDEAAAGPAAGRARGATSAGRSRPLTLLDTLQTLELVQRTGGRRTTARFLAYWITLIEDKHSFDAIAEASLPVLEGSLIAAASRAGRQAVGFRRAAEIGQRMKDLKSGLAGMTVMPAILIAEVLITFYILSAFFRPALINLTGALPGVDLPAGLTTLLWFTGVVSAAAPPLGVAAAGYAVLVAATISGYSGGLRPTLDRLWPYGIYRRWMAAAAFLNLAILLEGGAKLAEALEITARNAAKPLRRDIRRILSGVDEGSKLASVLSGKAAGTLLPADVMVSIRSYAARDRLDERNLSRIAKNYIDVSSRRMLAAAGAWSIVVMVASLLLTVWTTVGFTQLSYAMQALTR
jgi:type II secretory pathway component PulF